MSGPQNLTQKHVLQNGLQNGGTVYGTFMMLQSGWAARTVAAVGWDVSGCLYSSSYSTHMVLYGLFRKTQSSNYWRKT